jgi:putative zinc finger protein
MARYRRRSQPCAPGSAMARELVPFCDGELTPYRARLFREHLRMCEVCRRNVVDVMQLIAQLGDCHDRTMQH